MFGKRGKMKITTISVQEKEKTKHNCSSKCSDSDEYYENCPADQVCDEVSHEVNISGLKYALGSHKSIFRR